MFTYRVPVKLEMVADVYVEAEDEEDARHQAEEGNWRCCLEGELGEVHPAPVEEVEAFAPKEEDFMEEAIGRLVRNAHEHALSMSQVQDHPAVRLLGAALVMLGAAEGLNREWALTQASEDCRRALGENPPTWAAMRRLLGETLEPLSHLVRITESLDDGQAADGQDWCSLRDTANDLAQRIEALLEGMQRARGVPTVRVDVCDGSAGLVSKPIGVAVEIRDFDVEGLDPVEWRLIADPDDDPPIYHRRDYTGPDETPTD